MLKKIVLYSALSVLVASCATGTGPVFKADSKELSCTTEAKFIESFGPTADSYRATGRVDTLPQVKQNAKLDALCFALTQGENAILSSPEGRSLVAPFQIEMLQKLDSFALIKSKPKSRSEENGQMVFAYIVSVNKKALNQFLESKGVSQSVRDLSQSMGQQTIMVLKAESAEDKFAIATVTTYLERRKFNVEGYKEKDKHQLRATIATLSNVYGGESEFVNPAYASIINSGSDIYVKISGSIETGKRSGLATKKGAVTVKAFDTATNKVIGSATGYSTERSSGSSDVLISEAANDASNDLTEAIKSKWKDYAKFGKPFRVIIMVPDPDELAPAEEAFYSAMESLGEGVDITELHKGLLGADYIVTVKNVKKGRQLFSKLARGYQGPGSLKREVSTNNLLIVKIAEEDFEIELVR